MPKSTHSRTRVPHRGPRHPQDPDRTVKYKLRFQRKGDQVTPETVVVRRHRRTHDKPPSERRWLQQLTVRRRRRQEQRQLDDLRHHANQQLSEEPL